MRTEEITRLVSILRAVTIAVQFAPFIFVGFLIISVMFYLFINEEVSAFMDLMFYISPIVAVYNLVLSRVLKLCKWHRLECRLPLIPIIPVLINDYICNLEPLYLWINWGIVVSMFVLSIINAYFVFIKNKPLCQKI